MNKRKAIEQLNHSESITIDYGRGERNTIFFLGTGFDAYVSSKFGKRKQNVALSASIENIITDISNHKSQNYHIICGRWYQPKK